MDDAECKTAEVIAKNIDQLESAVVFAQRKMDDALHKSVRDVFESKSSEFDWTFGAVESFDEMLWLAPQEWHFDGAESDGIYSLFCHLGFQENEESQTWLAWFSGVAGRRVRLAISSDVIKGKTWKEVVSSDLMNELGNAGFEFSAISTDLPVSIPLDFDRDKIAAGFKNGDLSEAMRPLHIAIDKVNQYRDLFDRIAAAIAKRPVT